MSLFGSMHALSIDFLNREKNFEDSIPKSGCSEMYNGQAGQGGVAKYVLTFGIISIISQGDHFRLVSN